MSHEVGSLLHLAITVILSILYVKQKTIVVLPAILLSSIIGYSLGLTAHPFIMGLVNLAIPLLVFVAGLELKPDFIRSETERVAIMGIFEVIFFLSFFYVVSSFLPIGLALALSSLIVTSNEMFAIQISKVKGEKLGLYGITLSVIEDVLALFLLSVGFFTFQTNISETEIQLTIISILSLLPILFIVSGIFDTIVDSLTERDIPTIRSKILLYILYLAALVTIAEFLHVPESIIIFLGAIMLALRKVDEDSFHAMEQYLSLALIGFISSLPYLIGESFTGVELNLPYVVLGGIVLAVITFVVRGVFVFFSALLSGICLDDALSLGLALSCTGEFGLLVISLIIASTDLISSEYAFMAMFAYVFNLTFVSYVVKRGDLITMWIKQRFGRASVFFDTLSAQGNRFVTMLKENIELKRVMVEIALVVVAGYLAINLFNLVGSGWLRYLLSIVILASNISALQKVFQQFSMVVQSSRRFMNIISSFIQIVLLYVIVGPLLSFIYELSSHGDLVSLASPVNLFLVLSCTWGLSWGTHEVVLRFIGHRAQIIIEDSSERKVN